MGGANVLCVADNRGESALKLAQMNSRPKRFYKKLEELKAGRGFYEPTRKVDQVDDIGIELGMFHELAADLSACFNFPRARLPPFPFLCDTHTHNIYAHTPHHWRRKAATCLRPVRLQPGEVGRAASEVVRVVFTPYSIKHSH